MSDDQIPERFIRYFKAHQHVWQLFQRFTFQVINRGFKHVGAESVWRSVRWEVEMKMGSDEGLKFYNDWRVCYYARLFHVKYPEHDGFLLNPKRRSKDKRALKHDQLSVSEEHLHERLRQLLAETGENPEPLVNVASPPVNEQSSLEQLRQLLAETEAPSATAEMDEVDLVSVIARALKEVLPSMPMDLPLRCAEKIAIAMHQQDRLFHKSVEHGTTPLTS